MATPFLHKKDLQLLLTISFIVFFSFSLIYPQTVIKEKIRINPSVISPKSTAGTGSCSITFQVAWDRPECQGYIGIFNNDEWLSTAGWDFRPLSCSANVSFPNGLGFQFRLNLDENVQSSFTYTIMLNGVIVQQGDGNLIGWFQNFAYVNIDFSPSMLSGFNLGLIDDHYGFNTGQLLYEHKAHTYLDAYINCDGVPFLPRTAMINLSIEPATEGVSFYNNATGDSLGTNIVVPLDESDTYYLALERDYISIEEKEIYITAKYDEYSKSDTLTIPPRYYFIYTNPEVVRMNSYNRNVEVFCYLGDWEEPIPDNIKFNLEIVKDTSLIDLVLNSTGKKGKSFNNIAHDYGFFDFNIIPTKEMARLDTTIYIRVSTTNPEIAPREVAVMYSVPNIDVKFVPESVSPGDTADVILKKIQGDGTLTDFPQDQHFIVMLTEGKEFGTLFFPEWGDTSDYGWDASQGFKFIADESTHGSQNHSTLEVFSSAGGSASIIETGGNNLFDNYKELKSNEVFNKMQPDGKSLFDNYKRSKKQERFNKIQSSLDYEQLWGFGTITIGEAANDTLHHFAIRIVPDTLSVADSVAYGEGAKLYAQAKDANNDDIIIDNQTQLTLLIKTNSEYLRFLAENGDTLTEGTATLTTSYYNLSNGKIRVLAITKNPENVVACLLRVEMANDPSKHGERNAFVLEQTLAIEMAASYVVQPTYEHRIPVAQSRKLFNVVMTRNGRPVRNHNVKLWTNYVNGSGGHDHTNRRPDNNDNYGYFLRSGSTQQLRPLEDTTDAFGRIDNLTYGASAFGDEMKIYLKSTRNKLFKDSITITERIPDLQELTEDGNYELVGASQNNSGTNDPCRPQPPTTEHRRNHFGTINLVTIIRNIADYYALLHRGVRLRINDMSLEFGGLFDYQNNWINPHRTHRSGINSDVNYTGINEQGNCVTLNRRDLYNSIMRYCNRAPYRGYQGESDHYHIYSNDNN